MSKEQLTDDFYGIGTIDVENSSPAKSTKVESPSDFKDEDEEAAEEFLIDETPVDQKPQKSVSKADRRAELQRQILENEDGTRKVKVKRKELRSSTEISIERIRKLLGDWKFYDPDATLETDEYENEMEWTMKDLTAPGLGNVNEFLQKQEANTALDAVKEIREEERRDRLKRIAEYDRDGSLMSLYRIWSLIPPAYKLRPDELAAMLARRVLYNKDDIIAINKPYGISTTKSITEPNRLAVASALGRLRPLIAPKSEKLYVIHRLDKCTTGVLLLAASKERAAELQALMKERKVQKKYTTIVKNIPDPEEGIIDIPLIETKVGGRFKTIPVIRPGQVEERFGKIDMKHFDRGSMNRDSPVTEYKVLKTGYKCALVECTIKSGFTHQIRCHLGFGIGAPVLGDHKYSDYLKYLPQRLCGEMLHQLGIRSAKSRSLPMHLHAREVLIPEYSNGKNLHIKCLLPRYFVYVLKKLKLTLR